VTFFTNLRLKCVTVETIIEIYYGKTRNSRASVQKNIKNNCVKNSDAPIGFESKPKHQGGAFCLELK
jgi:hypothetical protein